MEQFWKLYQFMPSTLDQTVMSLDFALKGTGKNAGTGPGNEKYVLTDKGTQIEEEGSY